MDSACGLACWRPKWLRSWATPRVFLVVYGLLGTTQAMAYIYFVVSLTTLERRFKIPSKTTGIILSGNEISQILLSLFLSYFGGQRNRPLWISWGVLFCAASCFILALPHILYGAGHDALILTQEYQNQMQENFTNFGESFSVTPTDQLCGVNPSECKEENELLGDMSLTPLVLVFVSQFVLGIGNTLYYSLGQTYLDDNTKKTKTPMMLAYAMSLRTLGPVVGFVLGYVCLNVYIDPSLTPLIDKKDPRWMGAWWLGWIILGVSMVIFAFLIGMFPKQLPKKGKPLVADEECLKPPAGELLPLNENVAPFLEQTRSIDHIPKVKDFPSALMRLLRNKILIFNILSGVFYVLGGSGYITFLAKYLEVQFYKSSAGATIVAGPMALIGMISGFLLSGFVISKYKPGPRMLLGWNIIVGVGYIIGQVGFLFLSCPDSGLQQYVIEGKLQLDTACNMNCSCTSPFSPVCHEPTGRTYFSACHAGCSTSSGKEFSNCNCLVSNLTTSTGFESWIKKENLTHSLDTETKWDTLTVGACVFPGCAMGYYLFIIISTIINTLGTSGKIGNLLVNYRAVSKEDKSFTQGLVLLMLSLCALIPGPILYGAIIDSTCASWDWSCGKRGNCQLYDQAAFRFYINMTAMALTFVGVVFDVLVWKLGQNLDLYGEKEVEEQQKRRLNIS